MLKQDEKKICLLFAELIEYPDKDLSVKAEECAQLLRKAAPDAANALNSFTGYVKSQSLETLEELYSETFDITPATSLYFGYHLFGETPKRSAMLVFLSEAYKEYGIDPGGELADHVGLMLRYLSLTNDAEFALPLVDECILTVLDKAHKELEKTKNPYATVTESLTKFLRNATQKLARAGGVVDA